MLTDRGSTVPAGYSFLELMLVVSVLATVGAVAAPQLLATIDSVRAAGAARHVGIELQRTRMEAILRATDVGLQFVSTPTGYTYAAYADGNDNGIRSRDITRGTDRPVAPAARLSSDFPGVDFGLAPGLPAVDAGTESAGSDPIKLGSSNILTFSALGTSSSGSLYIRGRRDLQFVVRIYGETGKTRTLRFDSRTNQWWPL